MGIRLLMQRLRYDSESAMRRRGYRATFSGDWMREQLAQAETWSGERKRRPYFGRGLVGGFDSGGERTGFWVPRVFEQVDHVVNLHRVSTHVWSHFTLAVKNWVGIMRPDDRLWMHQLNYLKNGQGAADDAIRTECPYHDMLAELHLPTLAQEKLTVADAGLVTVSGGPDGSVKPDGRTPMPAYRANLVYAANDLVSADVVGLAILRMALDGSAEAACTRQPQTWKELLKTQLLHNGLHAFASLIPEAFGRMLPEVFYGADVKLCDPSFSNWDWLAVRRARELGLGAAGPAEVGLRFASDTRLGVPAAQASWIERDVRRAPTRPLRAPEA